MAERTSIDLNFKNGTCFYGLYRLFFSFLRILEPKRGDAMIYLQLKSRVILEPGKQLLIRHIADVFCDDQKNANLLLDRPVTCPSNPGIWKIPAIHVAQCLSDTSQTVVPMGPSECYVHYIPSNKRNKTHALRSVFAFILLLIGSMLAISWFHADVNMSEAQRNLFHLITGKEPVNQLSLSIPYAIGVFFGIALFYALLGKKGTISPLDIKLSEYHTSSEKAAGNTP